MSEGNDSGSGSHESSSSVSPETTDEALGLVAHQLEGLPTAPNGTTYGEFDSVDEEGNPVWLRMRQIPIELSRGGVVAFVYIGAGPSNSSPNNHYFFVSTAKGVRLGQHGSYEPPPLAPEQAKTLDDAVEALYASRDRVREDERRAGLAAVHEAEARTLMEMIRRAKLQERFKQDNARGRRISNILARIFRKR